MELSPVLIGPYLSALRAGLAAHAPNDDFVSLAHANRHLLALSPHVSGALLHPGEIDVDAGLPHHNWLTRARAEATLAAEEISQPDAPHPDLGSEIAAQHQYRMSLRSLLQGGPLLTTSRLRAEQRYAGPISTYRIRFDHLLPGAGWMRICADVSGPRGWDIGLLEVEQDDQVTVETGLRHLFLRHGTTPLLVLFDSLQNLVLVKLLRLSRTFIGPFWFPGLPLPDHAPDVLRNTLALHLFQEVVANDVHESYHRDPWVPPTVGAETPDGYGLFRERRLAVPHGRVLGVNAWAEGRGGAVVLGF
jgi:hypothetical protein